LQNALEELMCPHGVSAVLPAIFEALVAQKWQTNEGACNMIKAVATRCPANVAVCMPEIVPVLTQALGNARQAVKDAAAAAMTACMNTGRRAALGGLAAGLRQ
jgi:elongation factor 3